MKNILKNTLHITSVNDTEMDSQQYLWAIKLVNDWWDYELIEVECYRLPDVEFATKFFRSNRPPVCVRVWWRMIPHGSVAYIEIPVAPLPETNVDPDWKQHFDQWPEKRVS